VPPQEGARVDVPGPRTQRPRSPDPDGRRVRATAAGLVAFVVVVTVGLVVTADDRPRLAEAAASSGASPSPSASPSPTPSGDRAHRPSAPVRLVVDRGVTSVHLAWDPPADAGPETIHHYEVFRDGRRVGRTARPRFDVAGLTIGTRYRFWVVAVDGDGRASPRVLRSVSTKVPPLTAARLSGTYDVTASVDTAGAGRARFVSHAISWSLVPQCPDRACDVAFTATHGFGSGSVVTSGVLSWSGGAAYTGTWVGRFGSSCRERSLEAVSTLRITMRATAADVVGGLWIASAISGTIHERVRGCGGVPTASYSF
jgi:hypothetical protein